MDYGFTSVTFRNKNIEEIFEIAKKSNTSYIEWGSDIHVPYDSLETAKKVADLSKKYKIKTLSYGTYYKVGENDLDKFEKIVEITNILNAKYIRVWFGNKSSKDTTENEFKDLINECKKLCKIAKKYDIIIASEMHVNTYNDSYESIERILNEMSDTANYKTYWQTITYKRQDLKILDAFKDKICTIHVFQWKISGKRYPLAKGKRKWLKYLKIARENNMNLIMEFVKDDSEANFYKDSEKLKELYEVVK